MAEDHDDLYFDDSHDSHDDHDPGSGSRDASFDDSVNEHDDACDLDPGDSASQIGRAVTTNGHDSSSSSPRMDSPSSGHRPTDSHAGSAQFRLFPALKNDTPTTPPSRRTSLRSSRILTPTTLVPSKKERVRYSWQSIHEDEPNRPRIHVIKIVSHTATASAGFPGGEALGFSCSSGGQRIAAYNSARLFVLQTAALPVNVSQEYALRRRPLAVEIVDDGNVLAVLADEHTVNIYDLSHHRLRRVATIRPDHPTNTIALSPSGGLLAAAYEGGIEIFSLDESAMSTDRRAIRSPKMDRLVFSEDSSTLLGTTTRINASSTVIVSVPVFPASASGIVTNEELKEAWCTGILEPENISNSSHATYMRENGASCNDKLFAWNGLEDTFGTLDIGEMIYSNTDFPVAISPPLSTCGGLGAAIHSAPSIDQYGNTVAMIVNDRTVRLYIVPQDVEDEMTKVEAHSIDHELEEEYGCPFTSVRWVHLHKNIPSPTPSSRPQVRGRLIVTSSGGLIDPNETEETVQDVEGGRIILFDFDPQFAGQPGHTFTFNLGKAPPQALEEEEMDVATEVALVRRRTVTQNRSGTLGKKAPSLGRAATTVSRRAQYRAMARNHSPTSSIQQSPVSPQPPQGFPNIRGSRRSGLSGVSSSSEAARSLPDLLETMESSDIVESIEEPYVLGAPRSGHSLQRAATAANRHRFQALEERATEASDPEGVPLPTYTEEPNQPLPGRYRALAGLDIPQVGRSVFDRNAAPSSPVTTIATAPPTVPENFHSFPSTNTTPTNALQHPTPRFLQRAYSNALVSPITTISSNNSLPHAADWSPNISPVLTRPSLRAQTSWETTTSLVTQTATQSPLSRITSQATSSSPPNNASPNGAVSHEQTRPPVSLWPSSQQPQQQQQLAPQGNSFRHSMLLPVQDWNSTTQEEPRPPSAASTTDARVRPSVRRAQTHRPNHVDAFLNPQKPTQHPNRSADRLTPLQPSSPGGSIANSVAGSVGSIPHPVTNWYPPAPRVPSTNGRGSPIPRRPSTNGKGKEKEPQIPASDRDSRLRPSLSVLQRSKSSGTAKRSKSTGPRWFGRKTSDLDHVSTENGRSRTGAYSATAGVTRSSSNARSSSIAGIMGRNHSTGVLNSRNGSEGTVGAAGLSRSTSRRNGRDELGRVRSGVRMPPQYLADEGRKCVVM